MPVRFTPKVQTAGREFSSKHCCVVTTCSFKCSRDVCPLPPIYYNLLFNLLQITCQDKFHLVQCGLLKASCFFIFHKYNTHTHSYSAQLFFGVLGTKVIHLHSCVLGQSDLFMLSETEKFGVCLCICPVYPRSGGQVSLSICVNLPEINATKVKVAVAN